MPRPALVLLLLWTGLLLLLLASAAHGNDQDIGEAPSVVAPPFDSTGSGNKDENSEDGSEQTKTTTAPSDPGPAPPSKYPIYGPFIPSRDVVLLEEGPAPGMVVNPEDRDKAGRNRYEYVPTGPEGWYENGYGSNYYSAYPYPPDPYLADSQYYPDYGWDHFHEWPYVYVSRKDAASVVKIPTLMGPGHDDRSGSLDNGEEGTVHNEVLAAKEEANTAQKDRSNDDSGGSTDGNSDKQYGGGYGGGGGYPYGGGFGGGYPGVYGGEYGYPTYYTSGIGAYFRKGRKGGGFYASFGGGFPGYGGFGGGGYPGGGGGYYRRLRGPGAAGV